MPPKGTTIALAANSPIAITHTSMDIPIVAIGADEQPISYPIEWMVSESNIDFESMPIMTNNEGKTLIPISISSLIDVPSQIEFTLQSGDMQDTLSLALTPVVVGNGSGRALNHFYHQLVDDDNNQLTLEDNTPDFTHRIIYQSAHGTLVELLEEEPLRLQDENSEKVFYRAAVQFWIPTLALLDNEKPDGAPLPEDQKRIAQGERARGGVNDSWIIFVGDELPPDDLPESYIVGQANMDPKPGSVDVDAPDNVIGMIIEGEEGQIIEGWTYLRVEGWLARDVIGFLVSDNEQP